MNLEIYVFRLALALLIGGMIGLERQLHHRMAGARTHALVAVGSAAFVMTAPLVQGDPSAQGRIISYVVSGVGFLGAGVIFKEHGQVQGLNTAASIWCAAAAGTLAGIGFPLYSAVTAVGVLLVNVIPHSSDNRRREPETSQQGGRYQVEFVCEPSDESAVRALVLESLDRSPLSLCGLQSEKSAQNGYRKLNIALKTAVPDDRSVEEFAGRFSREESVTSVQWRRLAENASV